MADSQVFQSPLMVVNICPLSKSLELFMRLLKLKVYMRGLQSHSSQRIEVFVLHYLLCGLCELASSFGQRYDGCKSGLLT